LYFLKCLPAFFICCSGSSCWNSIHHINQFNPSYRPIQPTISTNSTHRINQFNPPYQPIQTISTNSNHHLKWTVNFSIRAIIMYYQTSRLGNKVSRLTHEHIICL
jgi:hypothetical protein